MKERKGNFIYTTECSGNIVVTNPAEKKKRVLTFLAIVNVW